MELTPEARIRWQSLLVALKALDDAGERVQLEFCTCGEIKIGGETGEVQWDHRYDSWSFFGIDNSEINV